MPLATSDCEPDPVLGTSPSLMPPKVRWQTEELATYYEGVGDVDGVLEILAHGVVEVEAPGDGDGFGDFG